MGLRHARCNSRPAIGARGGAVSLWEDVEHQQGGGSHDSLQRFRLALDTSADAIYIIDRETMRFVDANSTAYADLGYTRDELLALGPQDIKPRMSKAELAQRFDSIVRREDRVGRIETVHRRKDGGEFPVEVRLRAMQAAGRILLVAVARDVTEQELYASRLRESEERFRAVFEHSPLGIAAARPDGRFTLVNPAFCAMLGYTADELLELTFYDVTHPEDREANRVQSESLYAGDQSTFGLEKRYVRKSGAVFWGAVTVARVCNHRGEDYTFGVHEDITARRESERLRRAWECEQRDALVREVHHRIKNSVQGVVGLLKSYVARHPDASSTLGQAIDQVNAIAIVHGLQSQSPGRQVTLVELIDAIAAAAGVTVCREEQAHGVAANEALVCLRNEECVPAALVLNELIYNASKHGRAGLGATTVSVTLDAMPDVVCVRVRNEGQLPPGFDYAAGQSIGTGLRLVKALLPREGAQLQLYQSGTQVVAEMTLSAPVIASAARGPHGDTP